MLLLADGSVWFAFALGVLIFGIWGYTAYDAIKSRAGWVYPVLIFLMPLIGVILWWASGKWVDDQPHRLEVAKSYRPRPRASQKSAPSDPALRT